MKIQELLSITELARLLDKSRPSVYKYLADYESGNYDNIPSLIKELFDRVENGNFTKKDIYDYCYSFLLVDNQDELKEIYSMLQENKDKLNLEKIKDFIEKEIRKWRK